MAAPRISPPPSSVEPTPEAAPPAPGSKSSFFAYPKQDLVAGTVVFLVALPLCLGIAIAWVFRAFIGRRGTQQVGGGGL